MEHRPSTESLGIQAWPAHTLITSHHPQSLKILILELPPFLMNGSQIQRSIHGPLFQVRRKVNAILAFLALSSDFILDTPSIPKVREPILLWVSVGLLIVFPSHFSPHDVQVCA